MRFIDIKTDRGAVKGKIAFYCAALNVTRQGFYWYLTHRDTPWKYEEISEKMRGIVAEDECNDTYGRCSMYQTLKLKYREENIPRERTIYRIMEEIGLGHRPNPNGITKVDRDAQKSHDLFKRDFTAGKPLEKCVTDITEILACDGKLYVCVIFDCYDLGVGVLGLAIADNMKAGLCVSTIDNAYMAFASIREAVIHSDRGSQYTSALYRAELNRGGIVQSMNSDGGRCHDNAHCEAMWAKMKEELLYGRYDTKKMTIDELKTLSWRCFIVYWNTRRICSANGGLPPLLRRKLYYESLEKVA